MSKGKQTSTETDADEGGAKAEPRYVITVTSHAPRRRAGFSFGPTPVHLTEADLAGLTKEQEEALRDDPLLAIRPYQAPAAPDAIAAAASDSLSPRMSVRTSKVCSPRHGAANRGPLPHPSMRNW